MRRLLGSIVSFVAVSACSPTATDYCDRLHDLRNRLSDFCPELAGADGFDFGACPNRLEISCARNDLEILYQNIDCFDLLADCDQRDALSEYQNSIGELSQSCDQALDELRP